ncbi:MAG TPA: ferritin-like domain-containing protein [Alphaproteobacteria bacterium]|nr:ferritin-like domain-containing protein [Alphaproteobacteria bacterium]
MSGGSGEALGKPMALTLTKAARRVLESPEPRDKVRHARACAQALAAGEISEIGAPGAPNAPARPDRPRLLAPRDMPRRRQAKSRSERIALFHALAHIELNAIDLAFDLIARFANPKLPSAFYADWVGVGAEEAHHFELLANRLEALGSTYGALPAHGGLWQAPEKTADDLLARLAVVPLVLEARGLDVTPGMIQRLESHGDSEGADILRIILKEEIGHVAKGRRWFQWEAERRGEDPAWIWAELVRSRFRGELKPPFNFDAREAAGFDPAWLDRTGRQSPAKN